MGKITGKKSRWAMSTSRDEEEIEALVTDVKTVFGRRYRS